MTPEFEMDAVLPQLITDNMSEVRMLAREVKLCVDPQFRGECARLREDPRIAKAFFSRNGVTIDGFGEALWDRGLVSVRPTCRETLDLLELIFVKEPQVKRATAQEKRRELATMDVEAKRAASNRQRQFRCDACGAIVYGAAKRADGRPNRVACVWCTEEAGRVIEMTRYGKTMTEVLASIDYSEVPF